jgi:hypothetical protein
MEAKYILSLRPEDQVCAPVGLFFNDKRELIGLGMDSFVLTLYRINGQYYSTVYNTDRVATMKSSKIPLFVPDPIDKTTNLTVALDDGNFISLHTRRSYPSEFLASILGLFLSEHEKGVHVWDKLAEQYGERAFKDLESVYNVNEVPVS